MSNIKVVRYVVVDESQNCCVSYNCALGNKEALSYAIQNASRYHSKIFVETSDGANTLYKSYERK